MTWNVEHDGLFRTAANGVHQLEALHPMIVVGLGFDVDFLEPRDGAVARRPGDVDLRRAIVEDPDEVFGVAFARQTVPVGQRDAVCRVRRDPQRRRHHRGFVARERQRAAGAHLQPARRGGQVGVNTDAHLRPGRRVHVAAVSLGSRFQPERYGIGVIEIDTGHPRRPRDGNRVGRRRDLAGNHPVAKRPADAVECQAKSTALGPDHVDRAWLRALVDFELRLNRRPAAEEARLNRQRRSRGHARIARPDAQAGAGRKQKKRGGIERLPRRAGTEEPDHQQHERRTRRAPGGAPQARRRKDGLQIDLLCSCRSVCQHRVGQGC